MVLHLFKNEGMDFLCHKQIDKENDAKEKGHCRGQGGMVSRRVYWERRIRGGGEDRAL